ncbi:GATA transcription factor 16-like [Cynara cardunculus var. scolymus]|uniref:Zinc finger, GATA-type n=1 Tax=Cynara cardunculus var. scolymus TaxID=59895 RepID=A0A103XTB2_CYNCS|nr:GATA transcription factor 16-like [Cynara cardunculus var. scolymus]KVH96464.1 Zinc finger, GATA-type [Cynara cardunculus var. scolymus]
MVDLSDKGSDCEDMMNSKSSPERCGSSSSDGGSHLIKTCADCGTTKTPLWRGGPAGPKSLCNACGIRSRKKRRALLGLTKDDKKQKKTTTMAAAATSTSGGDSQTSGLTTNKSSRQMGDFCLKRKLMALGTEVVLQRPRSTITKQRRKLGEVEQAALLLMALSCGSVYA